MTTFNDSVLLNDTLLFNSSKASYSTNEIACMYCSTNAGAAYPFLENNNLVVQARSSVGALRDIVFVSGGTTPAVAMVIDRTQRVGIRNNAPRAILDVGDSAAAFAANGAETVVYVSRAGAANVVVRNNSDNIEMLVRAGANAGAVGTVSNHPLVLQRNNEERVRFDQPNSYPVTFMRDLLVIGPGQGTQNYDLHNMSFSLIAIKDPESRISWHDPISGRSRGYLKGSQMIANYNTQLVIGHALESNPVESTSIKPHLTIESTGQIGMGLDGAVPQGKIEARLSTTTATSSTFITKRLSATNNDPTVIAAGVNYRFLVFAIIRKNSIWPNDRPSIGVVLNLDIGAAPVSHTITTGLTIEFWLDATDNKVYAKRTAGEDVIWITLVGIWE